MDIIIKDIKIEPSLEKHGLRFSAWEYFKCAPENLTIDDTRLKDENGNIRWELLSRLFGKDFIKGNRFYYQDDTWGDREEFSPEEIVVENGIMRLIFESELPF